MATDGDVRRIEPLDHVPDTTITLPGSKSYTNRALVVAALASGSTVLEGALSSDDTRYMAAALEALGAGIQFDPTSARITVEGFGGSPAVKGADVFVGNAGTAARFLPPVMALGSGTYTLDGVERMRQRPIVVLLVALDLLGADVEAIDGNDGIPLRVHGHGAVRGGRLELPGDVSSQYASGLLLAAPYFTEGLDLHLVGSLVSRPYLDMTVQTMEAFGVAAARDGERRFTVPPGGPGYKGRTYLVEPDTSAASYFFGAAAITGGRVTVEGLGSSSLQGDLRLVDVLAEMGCTVEQDSGCTTVIGPSPGDLRGVDVDMADLSDVAQTLATIAVFASGPTEVRGIGFTRGKETDRVGAVVTELRRLGIDARETADGYTINPGEPHAGVVQTYDDHRMAMSFSLLGLRAPGIEIADPGCVSKTFPDFFAALSRL